MAEQTPPTEAPKPEPVTSSDGVADQELKTTDHLPNAEVGTEAVPPEVANENGYVDPSKLILFDIFGVEAKRLADKYERTFDDMWLLLQFMGCYLLHKAEELGEVKEKDWVAAWDTFKQAALDAALALTKAAEANANAPKDSTEQ